MAESSDMGRAEKKVELREALLQWLLDSLREGRAPRLADAAAWVRKEAGGVLSRREVADVMRRVAVYQETMHQQRAVKRYRKWRPITASALGSLHGDIAYFPMSSDYFTPPKYRAGCLVMVDVLSRFVYLTPLHFGKDAQHMAGAFERVLEKHAKFHSHPVRSISFDQERTVLGRKIQSLLRDNHIAFVKFSQTSSKAKLSENTIHRLRALLGKLNAQYPKNRPWWTLLETAENVLNNQPVTIDGKILDPALCPVHINESNVDRLMQLIYKEAPAYYFSQFSVDPSQVSFKFNLGDLVRAKLLVTSSQVIGEKRSAQRLGPDLYRITDRRPVVYRNLSIGQVYVCENIASGETENFDEHDLVLFENVRPVQRAADPEDVPPARVALRSRPRPSGALLPV